MQEKNIPSMDIQQILTHLPHRFPFLLIDKVIEFELGKSLTALKNVTINEPFFTGHFPQRAVMPGVLILEALAQASGILVSKSANVYPKDGVLVYFAGIDNARFKRIVLPGDQLLLETELIRVKKDIWKFSCKATVDDQLACSADLLAAKKELQNDR